MQNTRWLLLAALIVSLGSRVRGETIPEIERRIPPPGIELDAEIRSQLVSRLNQLTAMADQRLRTNPLRADVDVLTKAVDYALRHGEFYKQQDAAKASRLLELAGERIELLTREDSAWTRASGLVVRGYQSSIDGSAQPYGLVIPENLDQRSKTPLYVWLHGRGDKVTDLHFIDQRLRQIGRINPPDAIVLHPFGRQCIGYKSAGEIDVLEAIEHVQAHYPVDATKIVLMGFSMGGAGCWHIGAHYTDRFIAMSPGAGFAETAQYQRLTPDQYPSWYEQALWTQYDVPNYVRNLFNLPVIAYSGEEDKQIQAARVMEAAFASHGQKLPHLIGPGMGHKYHPDTLAEIMRRMEQAVQQSTGKQPRSVSLQTRTLRYPRMHWVRAVSLNEHWREARIDARIDAHGRLSADTSNVTRLRFTPDDVAVTQVSIDGQSLPVSGRKIELSKNTQGKWQPVSRDAAGPLSKRHGLQGPIDDAWLAPFLVVSPSGPGQHDRLNTWVEFELAHMKKRWRELFRGELRVKRDADVTAKDMQQYHLVLWGDPASNSLIARLNDQLPIRWQNNRVTVGTRSYSAEHHAPVMIYPNPLAPDKYVVVNSGPTFREAHDRTNSLQNPKLPDWAVLDLRQLPDASSPGKVVTADFFDEHWELKPPRPGDGTGPIGKR